MKPVKTVELLTVASVSGIAYVAFKPSDNLMPCKGSELCNHGLGHESQSSDDASTTYDITQGR